MNLSLTLSEEFGEKLQRQAAAAGQDVQRFVLQALEEKLVESGEHPFTTNITQRDFEERLQAIINLHPDVRGHVDDCRETIYDGRDE